MTIYAQNWKQRLAERIFKFTRMLVGFPQCWAVPWMHYGVHVDPVVYDGKEQNCTWCGEDFGTFHQSERHETYDKPGWAEPKKDPMARDR